MRVRILVSFMYRNSPIGFPSAFVAGLFFATAVLASAQCAFTSELNAPDSSLRSAGLIGPLGTVCVNLLDGGLAASITFTATDFTEYFPDLGTANVAANGDFSFSGVFGNCSGCTYSPGGSGPIGGLGPFSALVDTSSAGSSSSITLIVLANGQPWNSANDVLMPNGAGFDAAAQVSLYTVSGPVTGFVGESFAVPEPTCIPPLCGVLFFVLRRARRDCKS
jgi:hypothetical protein